MPHYEKVPPRAILFDLDNTLHDRNRGVLDFLACQYAKRDLARKGIDLGDWTKAFLTLEENGRVWKDVVYRELCHRFSLSVSPESLLREYEADFASFVAPNPGHLSVLEECRRRGWKTGLVTNGRSAFQRRTLAALRIESCLDLILISEECGLRKPDSEIYRRALDSLGCSPENSWFVGDDPIADVQGPRAIGMNALHFGVDIASLNELFCHLENE